ncbi:MAG: 16S rRNA (cytidine(1402)-2'-O)-methyltransferase [Deltaproteobacteria bacterium CG11_big_fil_rev_8_21_14_0_20_47_16]|nr:MAG: 16S rRNA (cytidine(1402)-2'-O)-methyltransferase [Deltaproteobacteria bacterium CG11_big_fil_rev_8_21_14_0_20_47_16]
MSGTLYIVSTPIGNLEDMTQRGIRILGEVDLVAAEDTRRTKNLLNHLGIRTPLTSFFAHNEEFKSDVILNALEKGKNVALVSDAGTPGLSDPGYKLICEAIELKIPVVPIPGASALLAALVPSGMPTHRFTFIGFLPDKKGRRTSLLEEVKELRHTLVFYVAKWDVQKVLREMADVLGDRDAVICRELTKVHEEFRRGKLSDLAQHVERNPPRGEFTLLVAGE